jgi:hypothetical protein
LNQESQIKFLKGWFRFGLWCFMPQVTDKLDRIDGLMPQPSNNKICIFQGDDFFLIGFVLFD